MTIVIIVILLVLGSWGYNTATLVAGLGGRRHCHRAWRRSKPSRTFSVVSR
ncbi:MAG: hypothetical protein WDO73_05675 [Ignavibacteriota bacterium]